MVVPSIPPPNSSDGDGHTQSTDRHATGIPPPLKTSLKAPGQVPQPQYGATSDAQNGTTSLAATDLTIDERDYRTEETAGFSKDMPENGIAEESTMAEDGIGNADEETGNELRRRVQWNDSHGKELVQVLEFEASDTDESEDEDEDAESQTCTCAIQ